MPKPLNFLLITTDQMRRDHMGCSGNAVIRTPHLDALAAGGVCLDRAYVSNPLCMPNRATIATGRLPRNHGSWCNGIPLSEEERTVADVLNEQGYHTALLGKGHLSCFCHGTDGQELDPCYDTFVAWEKGKMTPEWTGPYYGFQQASLATGHGNYGLAGGHYGHWLRENHPDYAPQDYDPQKVKTIPSPTGGPECFTLDIPAQIHPSSWLGDGGSEYLRQRSADGQPFLCWVSFPDPHHPYCPPRPYDSMYDRDDMPLPRLGAEALADKPPYFQRAYEGGEMWEGIGKEVTCKDITEAQLRDIIARTYGMISLVDENVGKLLQTLDQTGLAENTVVIFTSDHGDLMGDCGLIRKGPFLLEGLINVPMIWRVPGSAGGRHSDGLFSSCDIAPTILSLAGIEPTRATDGLPQDELVRGGQSKREAAFVEFKSMYHTEVNLRTVITAQRKLTFYGGQDFAELYDMTTDVPEVRNLCDDPAFADDRARLETLLLDDEIVNQDERLWPVCNA